MTHKALILSYVRQANEALREGNCVFARDAVARAIGLLQNAPVRQSASTQRTVMKAHTVIGRKCGLMAPTYTSQQQTPEGLMPPSYVANPYTPEGLLPPSFHGAGIVGNITTTLATLGIAGAAFGLFYGFWAIYKDS